MAKARWGGKGLFGFHFYFFSDDSNLCLVDIKITSTMPAKKGCAQKSFNNFEDDHFEIILRLACLFISYDGYC